MPVFKGVWVILPAPVAVIDKGLIGPVVLVVQPNEADAIVEVGTKPSTSPLQMVCARLVDEFVNIGTGFTVTITGKVGPGHP